MKQSNEQEEVKPTEMQDLYQRLDVSRTASPEELKKAFRAKTLQWHPDRNNGSADAHRQFIAIAEAYEVLVDKSRRSAYDSSSEPENTQPPVQEQDFQKKYEFYSDIFSDYIKDTFKNFSDEYNRGNKDTDIHKSKVNFYDLNTEYNEIKDKKTIDDIINKNEI